MTHGMDLIDTHTHLDDPAFADDRDAVLARAGEAGVRVLVNVGYNEARWRGTLDLTARHDQVYAALGLHPHEAAAWSADLGARLGAALARPRVVALGEIGLDFYRDYAPRDVQRTAFTAQLALALARELPVIVHSRAAEDEVLALLVDAGVTRGVLHSFSGTPETARRALDLGLHLSLTGPVSYPTGARQRELARLIPLDRLLLETDCPYLAPQPRRGRRNEPAFLPYTAEAIAAARGESLATVARATTLNARRLFGLVVDRPAAGAGPATSGNTTCVLLS